MAHHRIHGGANGQENMARSFWNVGSVPSDPEQMAKETIAKVQVVEESMLG